MWTIILLSRWVHNRVFWYSLWFGGPNRGLLAFLYFAMKKLSIDVRMMYLFNTNKIIYCDTSRLSVSTISTVKHIKEGVALDSNVHQSLPDTHKKKKRVLTLALGHRRKFHTLSHMPHVVGIKSGRRRYENPKIKVSVFVGKNPSIKSKGSQQACRLKTGEKFCFNFSVGWRLQGDTHIQDHGCVQDIRQGTASFHPDRGSIYQELTCRPVHQSISCSFYCFPLLFV